MTAIAQPRARAPRPLGARLLSARAGRGLIVRMHPDQRPRDLASAYATACELAASMGPQAGWKIGATSARAQAALGLHEPFFGRCPRSGVIENGDAFSARGPVTIDAEFVFVLRASPRGSSTAALREAVGAVRLGLEVNAPSYATPFALGGLAIVADNGAHAGLVLGPNGPREGLAAVEVRLYKDDVEVGRGLGAAVLSDPWAALAWLVEAGPRHGATLAAGDVVASGAVLSVEAAQGARISASADGFGDVAVRVQ